MKTEMCLRCGNQVIVACEPETDEKKLERIRENPPEVSNPNDDIAWFGEADTSLFTQGAGDDLIC